MIAKLLLLLATLWNGPMPPAEPPEPSVMYIGRYGIPERAVVIPDRRRCGPIILKAMNSLPDGGNIWFEPGAYDTTLPPTFGVSRINKEPNDQPHHN